MKELSDLLPLEEEDLKCDMCGCSSCGWKGNVSDCETEWESEGWEYPSYQVHICPECEDGGCVDDYWHSDNKIKEIEMCNGTAPNNSGYLKGSTYRDDDDYIDEPIIPKYDNKPEFIYSLDGERFDEYDYIIDEIYSNNDVGDKVTIYKGVPRYLTHWDFVKDMDLIGSLIDMAADEDGDFSEDYLNDVTPDIQKMILKDLCDSLNKHARQPNYCRVEDITEEIITVKDTLQGE